MTLEALISAYTRDKGSLTGNELTAAGRTAWRSLLERTLGRVAYDCGEAEPLVEQCFHELVDTIHLRRGGVLSGESVGQWTQHYLDASGGMTDGQLYAAIIRDHLGSTDLIYRGWPL